MSVKFNGVELNTLLEVVEGFTPYTGANFSPVFQDNPLGGEDFESTVVKSKTIPMPFIMTDVRLKYDKLMAVLNVSEPCDLVFGAQPDRVYQAIPSNNLSMDEKNFNGKGTIEWYIPSGKARRMTAKRSAFTIDETSGKYRAIVDNNGSATIYPSYHFDVKDDCGYLAVSSKYGVIQVGNDKESDLSAKKDQFIIADAAKDDTIVASSWTKNSGIVTENFANGGTAKIDTFAGRKWLTAGTYAPPKAGMVWGGYGQSRIFGADSYGSTKQLGFQAGFAVAFVNGAPNQKGLFQIIFTNEAGDVKVGLCLDKGLAGNLCKIRLYLYVAEQNIDIETGANDYVRLENGGITISKVGPTLSFGFKARTVTYNVEQLRNVSFTRVSVFYGKMENAPAMTLNHLEYLHVRSIYQGTLWDSPNTFMNGDTLDLSGDTGMAYRNNVVIPDTSGSTWPGFPPGRTEVILSQSSFTSGYPDAYIQFEEELL